MPITKTVSKKFISFEKEEQWLNEQTESGWRLIDYGHDGFTKLHYTLEVDLKARNMHYKIDFRSFKNEEDFEDYKELFAEAGWTLIANDHRYSKYIFISDSAEDIFSDTASLIERELLRQKRSIIYASTSVIMTVVAMVIYYIFHIEWLVSFTILSALSVISFSFSVWKGYRAIQQLKQEG